MKTLQEYIKEGILDDKETAIKNADKAMYDLLPHTWDDVQELFGDYLEVHAYGRDGGSSDLWRYWKPNEYNIITTRNKKDHYGTEYWTPIKLKKTESCVDATLFIEDELIDFGFVKKLDDFTLYIETNGEFINSFELNNSYKLYKLIDLLKSWEHNEPEFDNAIKKLKNI